MHNEGRAARPGQATALSDNYFKSKSHLSASATCENHYRVIIRLLPRAALVLAATVDADMVPHVESRYERSVESEFTARNDSAFFESMLDFNNR